MVVGLTCRGGVAGVGLPPPEQQPPLPARHACPLPSRKPRLHFFPPHHHHLHSPLCLPPSLPPSLPPFPFPPSLPAAPATRSAASGSSGTLWSTCGEGGGGGVACWVRARGGGCGLLSQAAACRCLMGAAARSGAWVGCGWLLGPPPGRPACLPPACRRTPRPSLPAPRQLPARADACPRPSSLPALPAGAPHNPPCPPPSPLPALHDLTHPTPTPRAASCCWTTGWRRRAPSRRSRRWVGGWGCCC